VRLVGSLENRTARVEEVYKMSRIAAQEFIKSQDAAKRHYMRDYFGREIDDPMLYHMIINTDKISYEHAARLIGDAVINRCKPAAGAGLTAS
jgi:cytidylate kinase